MIINTVFQEILNTIEFNMELSESNENQEFIINGNQVFCSMKG